MKRTCCTALCSVSQNWVVAEFLSFTSIANNSCSTVIHWYKRFQLRLVVKEENENTLFLLVVNFFFITGTLYRSTHRDVNSSWWFDFFSSLLVEVDCEPRKKTDDMHDVTNSVRPSTASSVWFVRAGWCEQGKIPSTNFFKTIFDKSHTQLSTRITFQNDSSDHMSIYGRYLTRIPMSIDEHFHT